MKEKLWGILVHLSTNNKFPHETEVSFDDEMWSYILDECVRIGMNTIILDIGGGIEFGSHPELAVKGAWRRSRVRQEVKRCKELGIALIPKLNFSAGHGFWLGDYAKMISTTTYYQVCNDLIKEVYKLFDCPEYIHIGMDEEDARHVAGRPLAIFRQKEIYWHDLNFLLDCVSDTGAKPWIWSCPLFRSIEGYQANVGVDDAVISPWMYHGIKKEHWTPIDSRQDYFDYYTKREPYKSMNLQFVEEDPYEVMWRKVALPLMDKGYKYIPCVSSYYRHPWNAHDVFEYFKENAPDEQILGYITAPWVGTMPTENNKDIYEQTFRYFKEAKDEFYG